MNVPKLAVARAGELRQNGESVFAKRLGEDQFLGMLMREVARLRTLREAAQQATSASLSTQRQLVRELKRVQADSSVLAELTQLVKLLMENERRLWDLYLQALGGALNSYDSSRAVVDKKHRLRGVWMPGTRSNRKPGDVRMIELKADRADTEHRQSPRTDN